jgi:predicted DCC family thiol-disulfide oxidoreductase YuxK
MDKVPAARRPMRRGLESTSRAWTHGEYALYRFCLGLYLYVHFVTLLPYGTEVFSNRGMLADSALSPLMGILPNVLALSDTPAAVALALVCGAGAALLLVAGLFDRVAAVVLAYLLACLYARNPLIANPSLPVVGWLLLLHASLPRPKAGDLAGRAEWRMPAAFFGAAWIVLAIAYSYSGYTKLQSPSWVSGDAIAIVLENPLARDNFLRAWLLTWPDYLLRALTWGILFIELYFAPLALARALRPWLWSAMLGVQLGFLCLLNFADLTAPMFLLHLLTLPPRWLDFARLKTPATLYYDGRCALCHALVRFALIEDRYRTLEFAPLQGELAARRLAKTSYVASLGTIVLQAPDGTMLERGDAVIGVLRRLGGLFGFGGLLLTLVPRCVRNAAYNFVGKHRLRVFGAADALCPIVPPELAARFHS